MSRRLITVSSVLSLAACATAPGHQPAPASADIAAPAEAASLPNAGLTTLAWGEEEDGGGTVVTSMAIGEEDEQRPVITSLAHGEEEDGSGTQIEDLPFVPPEPFSLLAVPRSSEPFSPVADIMARLRQSKG